MAQTMTRHSNYVAEYRNSGRLNWREKKATGNIASLRTTFKTAQTPNTDASQCKQKVTSDNGTFNIQAFDKTDLFTNVTFRLGLLEVSDCFDLVLRNCNKTIAHNMIKIFYLLLPPGTFRWLYCQTICSQDFQYSR